MRKNTWLVICIPGVLISLCFFALGVPWVVEAKRTATWLDREVEYGRTREEVVLLNLQQRSFNTWSEKGYSARDSAMNLKEAREGIDHWLLGARDFPWLLGKTSIAAAIDTAGIVIYAEMKHSLTPF